MLGFLSTLVVLQRCLLASSVGSNLMHSTSSVELLFETIARSAIRNRITHSDAGHALTPNAHILHEMFRGSINHLNIVLRPKYVVPIYITK